MWNKGLVAEFFIDNMAKFIALVKLLKIYTIDLLPINRII